LLASDIKGLFVEFDLVDGQVLVEGFPDASFKVPCLLGICIELEKGQEEDRNKKFIHYTWVFRHDIKARGAI
jgi:hypothetical protein